MDNDYTDKKDNQPYVHRKKLLIVAASISAFIIIIGTGLIFLFLPSLRNGQNLVSEELSLLIDPDQKLVNVSIEGIKMDTHANQPVILLKETDGNKYLPIWIGTAEAFAISLELTGAKMPRPMTHDLIRDVFDSLDATVDSVVVTAIRDDTYYAAIRLTDQNGDIIEIDSRPSDAIAIAVRVLCQIMVSEDVLESSGIEIEEAEGQYEPIRT